VSIFFRLILSNLLHCKMTQPEPMLHFPLKRADTVDWVKPLKNYVKETVNKHEAETVTQTLDHFNRLRKAIKEAADGKEKVTELLVEQTFYPYCALLLHAMAHFPLIDGRVKISFGWYDVAYRKKVSLPNASYEYASVMFNAAACFQQLGAAEDRSSPDGVKAAFRCFQVAAGLIAECRERTAGITDRLPPELSTDGLQAFSTFTLASAHQCSYLKAFSDMRDKFTTLSKVAMEGYCMYEDLQKQLSLPILSEIVDKKWLQYAEFWKNLFEARAHHHLAEDAQKQIEIGQQLGRLTAALGLLEQSLPPAKALGSAYTSLLQGFQAQLQKQHHLATVDNEKIYHERIPAKAAMKVPDRLGKSLGKPTPLGDLIELTKITDPFSHITPVHILDAHQKFRDEVLAAYNTTAADTTRHQEKLREVINRMGVVGAIGTFDSRTQDLPVGILSRIRAIPACASGNCLEYLSERRSFLGSLSDCVAETISQLLATLEGEARGDRELRGKFGRRWTRESSEVLNRDLVSKINEYSAKVQQARSGDAKIDEKLRANFDSISRLSLPETKLRTLLPAPGESPDDQAAAGIVARLKDLLKQITDKENAQKAKLSELRELLDQDNKELPMKLAAGGREKEGLVIDAARKRYEEKTQYIIQLSIEADNLQNDLITAVEQLNRTRKSDPANHKREEVINSLDQACNKYDELAANINEGIGFYARVREVMETLKAKVDDFVYARGIQKEDLLASIQQEAAHVEEERGLLETLAKLEQEAKDQAELVRQEKARQEHLRQQIQHPPPSLATPWGAPAPPNPPYQAQYGPPPPQAPHPPPYGQAPQYSYQQYPGAR